MDRRLPNAVVALAVVLVTTGVSYGFSSYATAFKNAYAASPLSNLSTVSGVPGNLCTVCHGPSGPPTNPFGDAFLNNGSVFAGLDSVDSDGDTFPNITEIIAGTFPGDPDSKPTVADTTAPNVTAFSVPATATILTLAIDSFTATDDTGVLGYLVTETATKPLASAPGWIAAAPTSYTVASGGAKTLYGWAKDAAGNVSDSLSADVTITLADTTAPAVTAFILSATASDQTVEIGSFTATDDTGVTGYLVTESSAAPASGAAGWSPTPPTSYTVASAGAKTLYAWAKDASGNVSTSLSAGVTITWSDMTAPTVTAFRLPEVASTLTVAISSFTAADDTNVTGYLVTESDAAPSAGAADWNPTAPTSYTVDSAGDKTLYAWAKDAAGNVSAGLSTDVTVALQDNAAQVPDSVSDGDGTGADSPAQAGSAPGRCGANVGPANLIAFYALAWIGMSFAKVSVRRGRMRRSCPAAPCPPVLEMRDTRVPPATHTPTRQ